MLFYLLRRILYAVPIALAVSVLCFMLVHISPGDPINALISPDAPAEVVEEVRKQYGLDQPLPAQYLIWLKQVVTGNFGMSLASGQPVLGEIMTAMSNTFMLSVIAALIGLVFGLIIGTTSALKKGTWIDKLGSTVAASGVSIPHYWLGMVLVVVFSVLLNWLPALGAGSSGSAAWVWDWEHVQYLVLPAITLSVIPMGIITRAVRGVIIEILHQDFITTLRGKGLTSARIGLHIVKNAAPSLLAIIGLQLGYLMGGSILVETVFSWPGTGLLLNGAIFQRDIPVLQGTILVLSLVFVFINLIVDVMQTTLDPRIKRS